MTEVARLDCRSARVAHAGLHAEQKDAVNFAALAMKHRTFMCFIISSLFMCY